MPQTDTTRTLVVGMMRLEKKLPLLLALGTKVQVSAEDMVERLTVSGLLTPSQLKAKLEARKTAGEDVAQ